MTAIDLIIQDRESKIGSFLNLQQGRFFEPAGPGLGKKKGAGA